MAVAEEYRIRDNETDEEYQYRLSSIREEKRLTWQEIADMINEQTGNNFSESKYRKDWKNYCAGYEARAKEDEIDPEVEKLIEAKIELKKEKVKLTDERTQANAYIRRLAREETIKEIAFKCASEMNSKKVLPEYVVKENTYGNNEAILCISDWHYGIDCENYWNKYNPEIAKERISELYQKTIRHCAANGVQKIHVVNLGDLIAGRIHLTLRLESRFDVITQTIQISEILAEFLNNLSKNFDVEYYDCIDNHSRLEPNKKDSLDLETLARIIPWYLKTRLNNTVHINDNVFGDDIITFNALNYKVLGVHGDKDFPRDVVDHLSMMTHEHYDLILTAHLHHFSADEKNETLVVSNGSLMGVDTYAKNLRLTSKPSQNLIIVTEDCVAECVYRIVL